MNAKASLVPTYAPTTHEAVATEHAATIEYNKNGCCARHPEIQLREKSRFTGRWKVLRDRCHKCDEEHKVEMERERLKLERERLELERLKEQSRLEKGKRREQEKRRGEVEGAEHELRMLELERKRIAIVRSSQNSVASSGSNPSSTSSSTEVRVSDDYTFTFGKHQGLHVEDVPIEYLNFIVETDNGAIWKKRKDLWRELYCRGIVQDAPSATGKAKDSSKSATTGKSYGRPRTEPPERAPKGNTQVDKSVDYTFDFGKHRGESWNDVPLSYRKWVLSNGVYNKREKMKQALLEAGIIERE